MDADNTTDGDSRWVTRAIWAFVWLGVVLRVGRYAMNWPLWWDEAFVGANLLRRGYLDLLRPLDYGQVCPLLFLWAELTVVKLLGFREATLRLVPVISGVASLFLFRHVAGRVLHGNARLLAVAIFAVAFHPIRHAADAKPYASDLLVGLIVLALALAWWQDRERVRWLWGVATFGPVAIGLSYPAAFVVGGVGLALLPAVWRSHHRAAWAALATFLTGSAGTFVLLFFLVVRGQARATMPGMGADWAGSFPPLTGLFAFGRWLVVMHAGSMLAYPCGGEGGASVVTLGLCLLGARVLWRRGQTFPLAVCVAPLGVALIAAALGRYPYGGSARFMLYTGPAICLLAGLGAAVLLEMVTLRQRRMRLLAVGLAGLTLVGLVPFLQDLGHPYRSVHAERARQFARSFWPAIERGGVPACLRWDYAVGRWDSIHLSVAVYLCNQKIYSPSRRREVTARTPIVAVDRPLRCVLAETPDVAPRDVNAWLAAMAPRHTLRRRETLVVNMAERGAPPREERYTVFELAPRLERSSLTNPTPGRAPRRESRPGIDSVRLSRAVTTAAASTPRPRR